MRRFLHGWTGDAIPIAVALRHQVERAVGTTNEAAVRALVARLGPLADLPATGIVHGEANPTNARRRADGRIVLLDWDEAGCGPLALEHEADLRALLG